MNARLGRILVVEEDPGSATQLVRGLTRAGYETDSVTTGKAALDRPVPDVFLLDLGLPDMDGVEVCRRLRQACDAASHDRTSFIQATAGLARTDAANAQSRLDALASSPPSSSADGVEGKADPALLVLIDQTKQIGDGLLILRAPRRTTTGWSTTACRPATGSGCRPGQRELRRLATTFNTVAGRLEALVPGCPGWWTACSRWRARRTSYRCPPRWTWPR